MTIVLLIILGLWIYGIYGVNFRDKNKGFLMRKEEEAAQKMYDTIIALTKEYHYKLIPFYSFINYIDDRADLSNKTNEEINYFLSYPKHIYRDNDDVICNGINIGKYEDYKKTEYGYYLNKYKNNVIINYEDLRKNIESNNGWEDIFYIHKPKNNKHHDGNFDYKWFDKEIKNYSELFKDTEKHEGIWKEIYGGDKTEGFWVFYKRKYKDITPEFSKLNDDMLKAHKKGVKLEQLENLTLEFYIKSNIDYFKTYKLTDLEIEKRKSATIINGYYFCSYDEDIIENKTLIYDFENDKNKTKDLIVENYIKNNSDIKERISDFAKEFKVNTYYSNY